MMFAPAGSGGLTFFSDLSVLMDGDVARREARECCDAARELVLTSQMGPMYLSLAWIWPLECLLSMVLLRTEVKIVGWEERLTF